MTKKQIKRRVVIKLGTSVVLDDRGFLAKARLKSLVEQICRAQSEGWEVILVSSGAVGLGRLSLKVQPESMAMKQACAAVGQSQLMHAYQQLFSESGNKIAQVLLTVDDLAHRDRYLALREAMEQLLEWQVVPIINENDTTSTIELEGDGKGRVFGDNDKLSALIAAKLDADLLVLLTDVEGLYTENPSTSKEARPVRLVNGFDELKSISAKGQSQMGRGGMRTKLEAASMASMCGVPTVIASGFREAVLAEILRQENLDAESRPGTLIRPTDKISHRRRWIGFSRGSHGEVVVNEGARKALEEKFASLLPAGVVGVRGEFKAGQVISLVDEGGQEIGRGVVNFSASETLAIMGLKTGQIKSVIKGSKHDVVVQRDNLVLFNRYART